MKRMTCLLLVGVLLAAFCACQPTPEKEIVANKGDGVLEQRISEAQEQEKQAQREQMQGKESPAPTPSPTPYAHPDKWELEMDLTNFFVHIQAEITVEQGAYPVVRLSQSDFSEKGDILSALMTRVMGTPTAKRQDINCYEDYVAMMEECVKGAFDFNTYTYRPYERDEQKAADRQMAEYAEKLKTALHEEEFDQDGTLVTEVGTEYTYCGADGKQWYVWITENNFSISAAHFTATEESYIAWEPDFPGGPTPPPLQPVVTEAQAEELAQKVLADFPGMEWELEKTERAVLFPNDQTPGVPDEWAAQGYLMVFTRKIGETKFFNYRSGSDRLYFEETPYAATAQFETLNIFADENGIQSISWWNPLTIEETVAGNVELLPFEQIQDNLVNLLKAGLSWINEHPASNGFLNPTRIAWIKKAVLAYAYVQEKDNPGKYLAVPTWFFTYKTEAGGDNARILPVIIAINAVDGTRISL